MSENPSQMQISSDPVKARYDKLEILRNMGRDPFEITTSKRNTMCADIAGNFEDFENKTVLCNCDDPFESNFCKFFCVILITYALFKDLVDIGINAVMV